jgi:hypothetical protein
MVVIRMKKRVESVERRMPVEETVEVELGND